MLSKLWNSLVSNRVVWAICAVISAFILWRYVITEENPTRTAPVTFTIEYTGESQIYDNYNLKVSSETPKQVEMKVSGTYSEVARIEENPTLTIDLSSISAAGEVSLRYSYTTGLTSSSVTVTTPDNKNTLSINIVKISEKTIDVYYNGAIEFTVGEGYVIDTPNIKTNPDQVTVSGPVDIIDTIDRAQVSKMTLDEEVTSTRSYDRPIELIDTNGNVVEVTDDIIVSSELVQVTIPIKSSKEVDLVVELKYGGGATEENVKCVVDPGTVTIDGDADALSSIESITLATIDLAALDVTEYEKSYEIKYPDGVTGTEKEANVKISISGVTTKEFTISNFSVTNTPEGYKSTIQTKELTVTLRGPADLLDSLDAANVRAVADLSEVTSEGAVNQTVTIYVNGENYSSVGAITKETNRITINLTKE